MAEKGDDSQDDEVPGKGLKKFCQPCSAKDEDENEATVFCTTCNEFQCEECSKVHMIFSFMKNHDLLDANEAHKGLDVYDMNGLDRCSKHEKRVKYFCKDDEKLCCTTCAITEHRKCDTVDEIKGIEVEPGSINTLKVNVNILKERNEAAAEYWINSNQHIEEQTKNLLNDLQSLKTSINIKFDNFEKEIKQQSASISEEKEFENSDNSKQCEDIVAVLTQDLKKLDAVIRVGTQEQQFIVQQRVQESLETMEERSTMEFSKLESIVLSLEFNQMFESLTELYDKLGSLKVNPSDRTIDEIVDGKPSELKMIASVEVKQRSGDTQKPLYRGMDFLQDDRLVVADFENQKCLVFNEGLEEVGSYKLSDYPQGLIAVSEDEVAITFGDVRKIDFLRVCNSNTLTHIRTIETTTNYDSICMQNDTQFVVGTYNDTKPMRIVLTSGEESDFNIDFQSTKYDLGDSKCTYIRNSDKAVLSAKLENTLYIYDMKTNTSIVVKDKKIKEPRAVTIGPFDTIFVCSSATHSIVQISKTGRVMSSHDLNMRLPYKVCISKDKRRLAVTNKLYGDRRLQLFSINV
ncbi:uncharacterized protein LOC128559971 [Mercenaria mercenaria]|uniref:uncharacterized protein LOC128559971 n=1 Tax=Mercenaria mercenaria TaxID=6596 RepID=UPI00234F057E|nr:uncharacterized protein LOC128559971 [Mercenaria mercenaria]